MNTYNILAQNMSDFEAKFQEVVKKWERMVKRGVRANLPSPPSYTVGERFLTTVEDGYREKHEVFAFPVTIISEPLTANDYQVVAVISALDSEAIVTNLGVVEFLDLAPFISKPDLTRCDHCHTKRQRHVSLVLRDNTNGNLMQVGSSCVKDFTGCEDYDYFSQCGELFRIIGEEAEAHERLGDSGGGGVDLLQFLIAVCLVVRRYGFFVTRKMAQEKDDLFPTSESAWGYCTSGKVREYYAKENLYPTDEDREKAGKLLAWAENKFCPEKPLESMNNYEYNMGVALRCGYVTWRTGGLVASVYSSWYKEFEAGMKEKRVISGYYLSAGAKFKDVPAEILGTSQYETDYGWRTVVRMIIEEHNVVWKATGSLQFEPGPCTVSGTVKEHTTYKDREQTVVTRCKIKED